MLDWLMTRKLSPVLFLKYTSPFTIRKRSLDLSPSLKITSSARYLRSSESSAIDFSCEGLNVLNI